MQLTTTTADDPYPQPFNWPDTMPAECGEERLYGLIPCPWQCEWGGWLPLSDGTMIQCPSCGEQWR